MAGAADTIGNSVILSAGYDITNGAFNTALAPKGTGGANVSVFNSSVTSSLQVAASGYAQVGASNAGNSTTLKAPVIAS